MKMSVFQEKFACLCCCQQWFFIFKLCDLISLYGDQVESFKQNNNVHKSCDTIPLRHLKWVCSTFKIKHIKYCRTKFQLETQEKITSSMSASEHFLKYFLEKRKISIIIFVNFFRVH